MFTQVADASSYADADGCDDADADADDSRCLGRGGRWCKGANQVTRA